MKHSVTRLIFTLLLPAMAFSQNESVEPTVDVTLPDDTSEIKSEQRWGALPAYAFREETGHQYGALVIHYLPQIDGTSKPSDITNAILYSTRNQFRAVTNPSIFWDKDRKHYEGSLDYQNWPTQFFGRGSDPVFEEVPSTQGQKLDDDGNPIYEKGLLYYSQLLSFNNFYELSPDGLWWMGIENRFNYRNISWPREGQLRIHGFENMVGKDGGITSGLGFRTSHDTRDNINSAHEGYLASWGTRFYSQALGSDFDYHEHRLDLRYYQPVGTHTLAFRTLQWIQFGDVPFYSLASTNGNNELRGIPIGFYNNTQLSSYQAEYRTPSLGYRLELRLFADISQIRSNLNEIGEEKYHFTAGPGIRWALNPKQKFFVRVDVPITHEGPEMVIHIKEAF